MSVALLDGLVAYWSLEEASGDRSDETGTYDLTVAVGTVGSATGTIADGAEFSLSDDGRLDNSSLEFPDDTWTLSFWWDPAVGDSAPVVVGSDFSVSIQPDNARTIVAYGADGLFLMNGSPDEDLDPHHYLFTFDGTTITGYFDGVADGSDVAGVIDNSSAIGIRFNGTGTIRGVLDEVGRWDRVLSPDEIAALYNSGAGLGYGDFTSSGIPGTYTIPASAALSAVEPRTVPATATLSLNGVAGADLQVATANDDAEQYSVFPIATGTPPLTVGTVESPPDLLNYGLWRFTNVLLDSGVTIHSATVQLRKYTTESKPSYWTWRGEATDDASALSGDVTDRDLTTASTIENTNVERAEGDWVAWDVTAIVQEIVNIPGWASGNSLALIAVGDGPSNFADTDWYDYDTDPESAATLTVLYQLSGGSFTVPASAALQASLTRTMPATAALSRVNTYSVVVTASLSDSGTTLGTDMTAALSALVTRTTPATAALIGVTEQTIPATAALQATFSYTVGSTAALLRTLSRSVIATATLSELGSVALSVVATAVISRPILILPPGQRGRPEFSLTLYGPLPEKRLINHLDLPPKVQISYSSELPGGWVRASIGIVPDTVRRALRATDIQQMILPEPVNVPAFGHAEIRTAGGHLVWEGRVSSRRQVGGAVRGLVLAGYGSSGLQDDRMPARSGAAQTDVVVQTVLREAAPLIEPLEIHNPGVVRDLSEFVGRHPYDVLEAVSDTGCGTCVGWTWTVYRRQLRFFPLSAPDVATYRVPVDDLVERDLDNERVYTGIVLDYTDLDGVARSTPVLRDYHAEERFEVSRILPLSGGQMTPSAALAFARSELQRRTAEGTAMALTRTWNRGLEMSHGGERPIWDVQAGESVQVGDEPPQYIQRHEYDSVAGRGTVQLGEPVFPEGAATWRDLVSADAALRSNRNIVTRTTQP